MDNIPLQSEIKEYYKSVLANNIHPFEQSVSRSDQASYSDNYDIQNHLNIDAKIHHLIHFISKKHISKLQPLVGKSGTGKTHYYWILKKNELKNKNTPEELSRITFYIPSPSMPVRIPLHILVKLIHQQGEELIVNAAVNLVEKFHASSFNSFELVKSKIIKYYGGVHSEIIRVLIQLIWPGIPQNEKMLAKRWLFAEHLDRNELSELKVRSNLENDEEIITLLRIIDEFSGKVLIFFFDELELIYRIHGAQAELKFWEIIKKLFNETKNTLIVTACLEDVWNRVKISLTSSVKSRFEPELYLKSFTFQESAKLFTTLMKCFWKEHFLQILPNNFFPLSYSTLEYIYLKTKGNQRLLINLISSFLYKVVNNEIDCAAYDNHANPKDVEIFINYYSEKKFFSNADNLTSEDIIRNQQFYQTREQDINQLLPAVLQPKPKKAKITLENENYFIDINPISMISAIVSIFKLVNENIFKNTEKEISFTLDYGYDVQGNKKDVALLIERINSKKKIGINIPVLNDLCNLSKANALYYIMDCMNALNRGIFDKMILILPENLIILTGPMLAELKDFKEDFIILEYNPQNAKMMIEASTPININKLKKSDEISKMLKFCYDQNDILLELDQKLKSMNVSNNEKFDGKKNDVLDIRDFLFSLNKQNSK